LISILCPFYNEESGVGIFFEAIIPVMENIGEEFEIVCVNDGSTDNTLLELNARSKSDGRIRVIDLSRNYGKEAALTAAIDFSRGDAVIPIDADLQDPPQVIEEMVKKWREGFDVVLAKRIDRSHDSFLKRFTAFAFYRLHNVISKPSIPENVGDFRLMSREVVEAIKKLPERQRFMKGLFAWVGFKTCTIGYVRNIRSAGVTKFNGWKLWKLAMEGITSFSAIPLTIWLYIGGLTAFCSFVYAAFIFMRTLIYGIELPGYASMVCLILFFGGLQLVGIGIIGEYLGRVYMESKQRPIYIVRENRNDDV
jgi:glycosyltransferase involved in cell wall biosynthesis